MIRLRFGGTPNLRLATSPAWELVCHAAAVRSPGHPVVPKERLAAWRRALEDVRLEALWAVISDGEYVPDFLVPLPTSPFAALEEDLQRIGEIGAGRIREDLAVIQRRGRAVDAGLSAATLAGWIDRPTDFRALLVAQMSTFWSLVVEPTWPGHRATLEREILTRGRRLALDGPASLLGQLHDDVRWSDRELSIACGAIDAAFDCSPELVLVPSVFVWPKVFVAPPDAGGSAVLYYPARGAATVFAPDGPGTVEDCGAELTYLLGGSRAGILTSLAEAATTTDLARELGMSPGAISQHLRRLARAGLVNRTRVGRRVYYEHSDRGARLLRLFRESDA